jgi:hypothetical protein
LKIGVVGYYGHGNFGDEWMLASMQALAPQVEFVPIIWRNGKWEFPSIDLDALLIGGGNILIPIPAVASSYFNPMFLEMGKPIVVWGVDFCLTHGYLYKGLEAINSFLMHPNVLGIWLRSPFDYTVAPYLFRSEVMEKTFQCWDICYTYQMELPADWNEGAALVALGRRLRDVWTRETTIRLEENLRNLGYDEISYIILGWDEVGKDDLAFTESVTDGAYIWQPFSIEEALAIMARYDMIISCKLHGIIAAALLRKRAKVLSGDNKFLSLCLAIPHISMEDFILQFEKDGWKLREIEKGNYLYVPEIIISQAKSEFNRALASILNRESSSDEGQP